MADATVPCTQCDDPVPVEEAECPHCGKSFITLRQAKVMVFVVYPLVLPVPAFLLAAAIPPDIYEGVGFLAVFGLLIALFYGLAAGWTWLVYWRRQRRIDEAIGAVEG